MSTVNVLAFITAKPGMRARVLEAFQANVPNVHAEDGCIEYFAATDTPGAGPIQTAVGEADRRFKPLICQAAPVSCGGRNHRELCGGSGRGKPVDIR